jgi:hypothetical protein
VRVVMKFFTNSASTSSFTLYVIVAGEFVPQLSFYCLGAFTLSAITLRQINSILSMREDCEMRVAPLFDAEGMSVFYVLTAADSSCQILVRLLERSNTNVFENAIEISKEIMRGTEVIIDSPKIFLSGKFST